MGDGGINLFDLASRISLDDSDVDKTLTSTQKKVISLAGEFDATDKAAQRVFRNIGRNVEEANAKIGKMKIGNLSADYAKFNNALTNNSRNVRKSSDDFLRLLDTVNGGRGALQYATTGTFRLNEQFRSLSVELGSVVPQFGAITGAAGPLAATLLAIGGAAAGIHKLATFSAELGGEIFDLTQKINFNAETVSALKIAFELSGGSLATLGTAFGIFDRNLEESKDSTTEISKIFKALKVDITDNEQALRQSFAALNLMKGGSQQTALAMKLFGRSGKEVLGAVKEVNGDIDAFIEKMRALGFTLTDDGAKKSDQFLDKLKLLNTQLEFIGRQIGGELVPVVEKAASDISTWLRDNQGELKNTAKELATVVDWVYRLAKAINDNNYLTMFIRVVRSVTDMSGSEAARQATGGIDKGLDSGSLDLRTMNAPAELPKDIPRLPIFQTQQAPHFKFTTAADINRRIQQEALDKLAAGEKKKGGGGGGGGGGARKDTLEGLKNTLMGLQGEFRKYNVELLGSANLSALAAEKEKLLANVMGSLNAATKQKVAALKDVDDALESAIGSLPKKSQAAAKALIDQALAQFKLNENSRIGADLNKQSSELAQQWKQDLDNSRSGADQYDIAIQNLEKAFRKYNLTLDAGTKAELEHAAAMQRSLDKVKAMTRERTVGDRPRSINAPQGPVQDFGGGSFFMEGGTGETRSRIATVQRQVLEDQMQAFYSRMRELASGLTNTIDRALAEGFSNGIKAGLVSFSQGILEMLRSAALRSLEKKLFEIFSGLGSGGDGGGVPWYVKLGIKLGLSVAGVSLGGFGGGKGSLVPGTIGKAAMGAPAFAGVPLIVGDRPDHRPEIFMPYSDGHVFTQDQFNAVAGRGGHGGGVVNHYYNTTLNVSTPTGHISKDTEAQLVRGLTRALQKRALGG
jgi:hypothetical protein